MADTYMKKGKTMAASNTQQCFQECVGLKVVGVIYNALPRHRRDLAQGNKTLIFDDGTGLTISDRGSFWREPVDEIRAALNARMSDLTEAQATLDRLSKASA